MLCTLVFTRLELPKELGNGFRSPTVRIDAVAFLTTAKVQLHRNHYNEAFQVPGLLRPHTLVRFPS
jgi:hypothetical protein